MTVDLDSLRAIGQLLAGGYVVGHKTDVVLRAADLIEAQEAEIDRLKSATSEERA